MSVPVRSSLVHVQKASVVAAHAQLAAVEQQALEPAAPHEVVGVRASWWIAS